MGCENNGGVASQKCTEAPNLPSLHLLLGDRTAVIFAHCSCPAKIVPCQKLGISSSRVFTPNSQISVVGIG